jgi:uncharacterized repeat protein (TIGR02543 family)
MKKFYAGIAFIGMMTALAALGCTTPTEETPVYSISLDQTGTYTFPGAFVGYGEKDAEPITVTVTNTGNQPTGALAIGMPEAQAANFELGKTSLPDIAAAGTDTFTVVPKRGLAKGTYAAEITVSGGNDISESFNVSFTVKPPPAYSISVGDSGDLIFTSEPLGYSAAPEAHTVTVANTGTEATGALTIGISGTGADDFTVSKTELPDIAAGGTESFTVVPKGGLPRGPHMAKITVSTTRVSASFNVSFRVNPPDEEPEYSIALSETDYAFPGAVVGYPQGGRTVTVFNTGNQESGELSIEISGTDAAKFTAPASLSSIAAGKSGSFTVVPATGLEPGTYTGTIKVSGENSISASFTVSFTVTAAPVHEISLDTSGHIFTGAQTGYLEQTAKTVIVTNSGNQSTGTLSIRTSSTGFKVSKTSIDALEESKTDSFTVAPVTGLGAGTHTATISVSGGNGISASFDVSFVVTAAPSYAISLAPSGLSYDPDPDKPSYAFPAVYAGYGEQRARVITVTNTGNQPTGTLTITGTDATNFTVSPASLTTLAAGATAGFTVLPKTGLTAKTYATTIKVTGGNNISANLDVTFTVKAAEATATYGISLDPTGTYVFPGAAVNYEAQLAKTVTVLNTGDQATGELTIAVSNAEFAVSETTIDDIAIGVEKTFTVAPAIGLSAGTHTATITVDDGGVNGINATVDVSFAVAAARYEIDLEDTNDYTFPGVLTGYGQPRGKSIVVNNKGNQPTGPLTITKSGTNPESFIVSTTSLSSIAVGRSNSFTVVPVTGLTTDPDDEKTYTATITVGGNNGISKSFDVSLTVGKSIYDVALDPAGTYLFPEAVAGYGSQTATANAKTVTVYNAGNQPTGPLAITKAGANPDNFTVLDTSLRTIVVEGHRDFKVHPVTGLGEGTYTAIITVSGGNDISRSFNVSFTVRRPTVTFNADGGSPVVSTAQPAYGSTVILPANPSRGGYTFGGWYTASKSGGTAFTAATRVTGDITVYARWMSSNANLAALSVNPGTLAPTFSSDTTDYTVTVPSATTSIRVNATEAHFGKAKVDLPANPVFSLSPGQNTIKIKVTAEDGRSTKTYTITVTRTQPAPLSANANLSSLAVEEKTLSPAFNPAITAYTLLVPAGASPLTVNAAVADTGKATLIQSPQNPVSLGTGSTSITFTVTAEDGKTTKVYTLTVSTTDKPNAVNVTISKADERIDLTTSTANDLSREAEDTLTLTAPEGYTYAWKVDGGNTGNTTKTITIQAAGYGAGTHSVLLEYKKDNITYGCEVIFKVVR